MYGKRINIGFSKQNTLLNTFMQLFEQKLNIQIYQ